MPAISAFRYISQLLRQYIWDTGTQAQPIISYRAIILCWSHMVFSLCLRLRQKPRVELRWKLLTGSAYITRMRSCINFGWSTMLHAWLYLAQCHKANTGLTTPQKCQYTIWRYSMYRIFITRNTPVGQMGNWEYWLLHIWQEAAKRAIMTCFSLFTFADITYNKNFLLAYHYHAKLAPLVTFHTLPLPYSCTYIDI